MAFGLEKDIFTKQLRKIGATACDSPYRDHYLLVNEKYEVCYTNFYYRLAGSDSTIGQGKQDFLKLIELEMAVN